MKGDTNPPAQGDGLSVNLVPRGRLPIRRPGRHTRIHEITFSRDDSMVLVLSDSDEMRPVALNKKRQRLQGFDLGELPTSGDSKSSAGAVATSLLKNYHVRGKGAVAIGPAEAVHHKGNLLSKSKTEIHHAVAVSHDTSEWGHRGYGVERDGGTYMGDIEMDLLSLTPGSDGSFRKNTCHMCPIVAPIAFSPDGASLAGVSGEEPSEIIILDTANLQTHFVKSCIHGHLAPIVLFQFTPDGNLISLAKDGVGRLCTARPSDRGAPGALISKFRVDTKYPPSLLRVSPNSELIVSVWGRQMVLWYPSSDTTTTYDLDEARPIELWPLAISPDCQLLVCRSERGIDIVDVFSGNSYRHATWDQDGTNAATAVSISNNGKLLAVGLQNSAVIVHELVVKADSSSSPSKQEPPPAYTKMDG